MRKERHGYDKIELQMRIGWNIGHHAGDDQVVAIVFANDLSYGVVGSKIFLRHVFGDHDAVGPLECVMNISFYQGEREDGQKSTVRIEHAAFHKLAFANSKKHIRRLGQPHGVFDHRHHGLKTLWHTRCRYGGLEVSRIGSDAVNLAGIFMKPVITQFMLHPEQDQDTGRHTDGETGNIDQGISLVTYDISESDLEIVSEHGRLVIT